MLSSILVLLAATSAGTPAPANRPIPHTPITACGAVTRIEVSQALGMSVGKGEEQTAPLASTCDYAGRSGQVSITVQKLTARLDMDVEIASLRAAIPESKVRWKPGLGTRAFFLDIAGAGTQLHVIRGDQMHVMISVLGFGEAEQVSMAAERLARQALERL
jgi:hypothetical protein